MYKLSSIGAGVSLFLDRCWRFTIIPRTMSLQTFSRAHRYNMVKLMRLSIVEWKYYLGEIKSLHGHGVTRG